MFGGDFKQILPVIPRGSRQDIVLSSLNSSYIWSSCKVLNLTKNMRLPCGSSLQDNDEVKQFSQWLLDVGDGEIGMHVSDEQCLIDIPDDILIRDYTDPIKAIADAIYTDFSNSVQHIDYFRDRTLLAPTLEDVAA